MRPERIERALCAFAHKVMTYLTEDDTCDFTEYLDQQVKRYRDAIMMMDEDHMCDVFIIDDFIDAVEDGIITDESGFGEACDNFGITMKDYEELNCDSKMLYQAAEDEAVFVRWWYTN